MSIDSPKEKAKPFGSSITKEMDPKPVGCPINNESYAGNSCNNELERPAQDLTPIIILKAKYIQNTLMERDITTLIDSGSTGTMIKRSSLPYGAQPSWGPNKKTTTTNGVLNSSKVATIQSIKCPEFNRNIQDIKGDC